MTVILNLVAVRCYARALKSLAQWVTVAVETAGNVLFSLSMIEPH